MAEQLKSGHILTSYLKIKELHVQLDTSENNEWMRLMQAPEIIQKKLNAVLKEREIVIAKKLLSKLICEIEELLKIAAHHKFTHGNSVRIWSSLKSIHFCLMEFGKSLNA